MPHIVLTAHNEFLRVRSAINIMHSIPTSPFLEVTTSLEPRLFVPGFVLQLCLEPRLSVLEFVLQLWRNFIQSCKTKSGMESPGSRLGHYHHTAHTPTLSNLHLAS